MNLSTYKNLAQKTSAPIDGELLRRLTDVQILANIVDALLVIKTEAECLDPLKKHVFYGKEIDPEDISGGLPTCNEAESILFAKHPKLIHGIIGIATELGELIQNLFNDEFDEKNIKEETTDILWYVMEVYAAMGVDPNGAAEENIEKLRKRYPEKFFRSTDAVERKDKVCSKCTGLGVVPYRDCTTRCVDCNGTGEVK